MNTLRLIVVTLLVIATSAQNQGTFLPIIYGYEQGQKCPGRSFYDDCNRCRCRPNDINAVCTKSNCPEPLPGTDLAKPLYAPNYKPGDACPAKHFYDGCNKCICTDGGIASCTEKLCVDSNSF